MDILPKVSGNVVQMKQPRKRDGKKDAKKKAKKAAWLQNNGV